MSALQQAVAAGGSGGRGVSVSGRSPKQTQTTVPEIELSHDERAVNDAVIAALANRKDLYDFSGSLAAVQTDNDTGRKVISRVALPTLREIIAETVRFITHERDAKGMPRVVVHRPPKWTYEAIHKRGRWKGIPAIRGVVTCPVLRADGSILQASGFDPASGLYVDLIDDFPEIPDTPAADDVHAAIAALYEILADFPFANDTGRAAWLAGLLTPLSREAHSGVTGPMVLIDANTRGSGKTLLADVTSLIVTGSESPKLTCPREDEEWAKRITGLVLEAQRVVLIDNVSGKLGCASLDAALTATTWRDRRLKTNEMIELPLRVAWYATGNNLQLGDDTARRYLHVRLESPVENPEDRSEFRIPDIKQHVRTRRPSLLAAALTVLRGYIAAGRPKQNLPAWGGFESWSDLVRSAIVWAGQPDPADSRIDLRQTSDTEAAGLAQMIAALDAVDPEGHGLRSGDLLRIAQGKDQGFSHDDADTMREALESICDSPLERLNTRRIGSRLGHFRSRVCGGKSLEHRTKAGTLYWLVNQPSGGFGGSGGSYSLTLPNSKSSFTVHNGMETLFPFGELRETDPPQAPHPPSPDDGAADVDWLENSHL